KMPTAIAEAAARLSERYITDRFLPDKAIDLLDEAAAHVSLGSPIIDKRHRLADETLELKKQKEALETKADAVPEENKEEKEAVYKELAELKSRELQLQTEVEQVEKECASVALTVEDIAAVVEIWTGIPASSVSADEFERLDKLKDRLLTHIVGQDEAVSAVCRAIKRKRAGVSYHKAPVSFIFAGPTGVGKTELVKVLAEDLFKQPESLVRLDMSEFMEKFSVSRIIGAPPGYVGFDEAGQLTEKIRRRPYSVVLFDEIEKAHPDVLNILLQILDDGMVTDAHGKKVSFENTVIVMTTNAGAESGVSVSGFSGAGERADTDKTAKALSSFLRPEFLNRVDEIITFHRLTKENFSAIADIQMKKLKDALAEKNITLTYTREALAFIAEKSYSEKYGARNMRRFIQREIEDVLAEQIISHRDGGASMATVTVKDNALCVTVL
ncbi:MAG: ATP-dependent Clp protease ATP-binding subunit, partial [Clostridia bacterium]|nr:ATP-dependent Clp protease ATP-binding subunit [Clostridia bacterium]